MAVRSENLDRVTEAIMTVRTKHGMEGRTSEVQWKSAKKRRDNIYRAYIELLKRLVDQNLLHLHIRLTPAHGRSIKPEDISKAFYQLLLHRAGRYYAPNHRLLVRPDNGCCTEYLPKMRLGLNRDIQRKFLAYGDSIGEIVPRNSRDEHLLQLLDVTLGAVTSARNSNHINGGVGAFKAELIEHALHTFKVKNLVASSPMSAHTFNLWNVKPD